MQLLVRAEKATIVRHVLADELFVVQRGQAVSALTNDYRRVSLAPETEGLLLRHLGFS